MLHRLKINASVVLVNVFMLKDTCNDIYTLWESFGLEITYNLNFRYQLKG